MLFYYLSNNICWAEVFCFHITDSYDSWISDCNSSRPLHIVVNVRPMCGVGLCLCVHILLCSDCLKSVLVSCHFYSFLYIVEVLLFLLIINTEITLVFLCEVFSSFVLAGGVGSRVFPTVFTLLTTFLCHYSSHQALLRRDDSAGLFHPTPAAGRQHGWHLPGAPMSAGHQPGANHSAQHQHNLHHWWVWHPIADSESQLQVSFLASVVYHRWVPVTQPAPVCWVAFSVLAGSDSWLWCFSALAAFPLPRKKRK